MVVVGEFKEQRSVYERPDLSQYTFSTPATFRLRLLGLLDASWSDELGGADIDYSCIDCNRSLTILTAHIVDQAALIGLINRLYGLGFPLLSVECMQVD